MLLVVLIYKLANPYTLGRVLVVFDPKAFSPLLSHKSQCPHRFILLGHCDGELVGFRLYAGISIDPLPKIWLIDKFIYQNEWWD